MASRFKSFLFLLLLISIATGGRLAAQEITGFGSGGKNPFNTSTDFMGGWTGTVSATALTVTGGTTFGGGIYQVLQTPVSVSSTASLTLTGTLTQAPSSATFHIVVYDSSFNSVGYVFTWSSFSSTSGSVTVQLDPASSFGTFNGTATSWELDTSGAPGDAVSFVFDDLTFGPGSGGGGGGGGGSQKQTITFPAIATQTFGSSPFALNATSSSGLTVTYSIVSGPATVAGNVITLTGAGVVTVQADQAGNGTYAAATAVKRAFTVKAGVGGIALSQLTSTYAPLTAQAPVVTTTPPGLAYKITIGGKTTLPINAGTYAVAATITDPNYIGTTKGTFVIAKAVASVTIGNITAYYNGTGHAATSTTNPSGLTVTYTYNAKPTLPVLVGTYTVVGTVNNANYTGSGSGTLSIIPAPAVAYQSASEAEVTQGVSPNGVATTIHYEYGTTTAYGSQTTAQNIGAGKVPVSIYALFPNLLPNTLYYYRLVTVTAAGTTYGPQLTFTTLDFDTALVVQKGTAVTGIGGTFASFGSPAINAFDTVAVTGTLTPAAGITAANNLGIWTFDNTNTQTLIARVGSAAPGTNGNFVTLSDPVINDNGNVAFRATAGKPALAAIYCTDNSGTLQLIAQQGGTANGTGGKFATFTSLGLSQTGGPVVYATLALDKVAGITAANYAGIFEGTTAGNFHPVLRLGDVVNGKTITKLAFQPVPAYVNGQSRFFNAGGDVVALATFSDKTTGIVSVVSGIKSLIAFSGESISDITGSYHLLSFGTPAINDQGRIAYVENTDRVQKSSVVTTQYGFTNLQGISGEPVINNNGKVAYRVSYVDSNTHKAVNGIYVQNTSSSGVLTFSGGQAPGCPAGANFSTFTELALPDQGGADNLGGVVFMATLTANPAAGVTAANSVGIWAADNAGDLQLVVRTGDILNGKTVTGLAFLPSPLYVNGQTRSFAQANGDLVYVATFSDKSTAIFSVAFP